MLFQRLLPSLAIVALAAAGEAQDIGSPIGSEVELEGFSQTGAKSFNDYTGRLVLIESFAYW